MEKPSDRLVNLVGALSQAIADRVRVSIAGSFPAGGETAAALIAIGHEPGMSIDQISRTLRLSHAGAVRAVERLEILAFVSKSQSLVDRRKVSVALTDAGASERAKLLDIRNGVISGLLARIEAIDRTVVERVAEAMLRSLPTDQESAKAICRLCDEKSCVDCPIGQYRCAAKQGQG